jgi:hypothetical protein
MAEDGATIYPGSNLCKMNPANNRRALLTQTSQTLFSAFKLDQKGHSESFLPKVPSSKHVLLQV